MRIISLGSDSFNDIVKSLCVPCENETMVYAQGFNDCNEAMSWLKVHYTDTAIININTEKDLDVADRLREIIPHLPVAVMAESGDFALEAYKKHIFSYMLMPQDIDSFTSELLWLKNYRVTGTNEHFRVRIQTFGNFDIFVDGRAVKFKRSISKEILAYLVDKRGTSVSMAELETLTNEYTTTQNSAKTLVRLAILDIKRSLSDVGGSFIIEKRYNSIRIIPEHLECDYYKFLAGDIATINSFSGEYMSKYSWAEVTGAWLGRK